VIKKSNVAHLRTTRPIPEQTPGTPKKVEEGSPAINNSCVAFALPDKFSSETK
jgi:hypothetical protein